MPGQLQHYISQTNGNFSNPEFNGYIDSDNLSERFERNIPLHLEPGKAHYEALDLTEYLSKGSEDKRGEFLPTVRGYKPTKEETNNEEVVDENAEAITQNPEKFFDKRIILVNDLGANSQKSIWQ